MTQVTLPENFTEIHCGYYFELRSFTAKMQLWLLTFLIIYILLSVLVLLVRRFKKKFYIRGRYLIIASLLINGLSHVILGYLMYEQWDLLPVNVLYCF